MPHKHKQVQVQQQAQVFAKIIIIMYKVLTQY